MSNGNLKNHIDLVIRTKSFYCGNCDVLVSLQSGVDYFYFGNGISSSDNVNSNGPSLQQRGVRVGHYSTISYLSVKNYFEGDFVVGKCEKCLSININEALVEVPHFIVPTPKEFQEIKRVTKIEDEKLVGLIEEFYKAKSLNLKSSATLLGRKILMHICVEQKIAEANERFIVYVDALKASSLIGSNLKPKVEQLRILGNEEAHDTKIASTEDLANVAAVIGNLLTSIYLK